MNEARSAAGLPWKSWRWNGSSSMPSRWASVRPSSMASPVLGYGHMPPVRSAPQPDWLGVCRRATEALRAILAESPTTRERAVETGERGQGGDWTLEIDQAAEGAVFGLLDELHDAGHRFTA